MIVTVEQRLFRSGAEDEGLTSRFTCKPGLVSGPYHMVATFRAKVSGVAGTKPWHFRAAGGGVSDSADATHQCSPPGTSTLQLTRNTACWQIPQLLKSGIESGSVSPSASSAGNHLTRRLSSAWFQPSDLPCGGNRMLYDD